MLVTLLLNCVFVLTLRWLPVHVWDGFRHGVYFSGASWCTLELSFDVLFGFGMGTTDGTDAGDAFVFLNIGDAWFDQSADIVDSSGGLWVTASALS